METAPPKKNLLIEAAKRKAEAQASGKQVGILGKDLAPRRSRAHAPQSYKGFGGWIKSGKP